MFSLRLLVSSSRFSFRFWYIRVSTKSLLTRTPPRDSESSSCHAILPTCIWNAHVDLVEYCLLWRSSETSGPVSKVIRAELLFLHHYRHIVYHIILYSSGKGGRAEIDNVESSPRGWRTALDKSKRYSCYRGEGRSKRTILIRTWRFSIIARHGEYLGSREGCS